MSVLPNVVIHADWSLESKKQIQASARRLPDGRFRIGATCGVRPAGSPGERLGLGRANTDTGLVGFDFPIGIPAGYARMLNQATNISSFRDALAHFGSGKFCDFYKVCETAREISLYRPFYPYRPGGTERRHLEDALGLRGDQLFRQCERATASRKAACPLFWTLGGNQVGKAALCGWKEFVEPMLRDRDGVGLWPFDGTLSELLATRQTVILETYPAEFYGHLGVHFSSGDSKKSQRSRRKFAAQLLKEASTLNLVLDEAAANQISDGFGVGDAGEDHFDAMIGLFGMLKHLAYPPDVEVPSDPDIASFEGWIIGQAVPTFSGGKQELHAAGRNDARATTAPAARTSPVGRPRPDRPPCLCGCGSYPRGKHSRFMPGHDQRINPATNRRFNAHG